MEWEWDNAGDRSASEDVVERGGGRVVERGGERDNILALMAPSVVSMDTDFPTLLVSMVTGLPLGRLPAKMGFPDDPTTALEPMSGTRSPRAWSVEATNSSQLSLNPTSTWGGDEEVRRDGEEVRRDGEEVRRDGKEVRMRRDGEEVRRDGEECLLLAGQWF